MDWYQSILLAIIQGLTEFLPISSSAHLIIPMYLTNWVDQGLAFDTCVHLGSLFAVIWYFRKDILRMIQAVWHHLAFARPSDDSHFAFSLLIASLPIIPVGYFLKDTVETDLRSGMVIAIATIGFGLLLWWADRTHRERKPDHALGWGSAFFIGCMQCLALIPGASRSGTTLTMGLILGFTRASSMRMSFLLSIPAIALSGFYELFREREHLAGLGFGGLLLGTLTAAVVGYGTIAGLLHFLKRHTTITFAVYRIGMGIAILWLLHLGKLKALG